MTYEQETLYLARMMWLIREREERESKTEFEPILPIKPIATELPEGLSKLITYFQSSRQEILDNFGNINPTI